MKNPVFRALAISHMARQNCIRSGKAEQTPWIYHWEEVVGKIVKNHFPSGSGIDSGNELNYERSKENYLVINSAFHVLDENGFYDGWIQYYVVIKPSLANEHGFELDFQGRSSEYGDQGKAIKEMLYDIYQNALIKEVDV